MLSKRTSFSLKAIRTNLGLTQVEASELIGVSRYTLANYESFKTVPNINRINKIASVYGVSVDEIRFLPNEKEKKLLAVKNKKKYDGS